MKEYLSLIKDFEGIIGAILGVIITMVTTQTLKSIGKLQLFMKEYKVENEVISENGFTEYRTTNTIDGSSLYFNIKVNIYNSSESYKLMRDIKICFNNNKTNVFEITPYDRDNEIHGSRFNTPNSVDVINLEPKKCVSKEFYFHISDKELSPKLKSNSIIYLQYRNEKNKCKKILIKNQVL